MCAVRRHSLPANSLGNFPTKTCKDCSSSLQAPDFFVVKKSVVFSRFRDTITELLFHALGSLLATTSRSWAPSVTFDIPRSLEALQAYLLGIGMQALPALSLIKTLFRGSGRWLGRHRAAKDADVMSTFLSTVVPVLRISPRLTLVMGCSAQPHGATVPLLGQKSAASRTEIKFSVRLWISEGSAWPLIQPASADRLAASCLKHGTLVATSLCLCAARADLDPCGVSGPQDVSTKH